MEDKKESVNMDGKELEQATGGLTLSSGLRLGGSENCPNGLTGMQTEICKNCEHCNFAGNTGRCENGIGGIILRAAYTPAPRESTNLDARLC